MNPNEAWGKFAESGKITDYLEYRRRKESAETAEELFPQQNKNDNQTDKNENH